MLACERMTGLTAVPPLWIQLAAAGMAGERSPSTCATSRTPAARCRAKCWPACARRVPSAQPFLMYGLTEAFRSTYLPPDRGRSPARFDRQRDSQCRSCWCCAPTAALCDPGEPGELVHRGSTGGLGYWGDPDKTAERFQSAAGGAGSGLVLTEIGRVLRRHRARATRRLSVFRRPARRDDQVLGLPHSPVEVEEAVYATGLVAEAAALGLPDARLGQTVGLVVLPSAGLPPTYADASELLIQAPARGRCHPTCFPQRMEVPRIAAAQRQRQDRPQAADAGAGGRGRQARRRLSIRSAPSRVAGHESRRPSRGGGGGWAGVGAAPAGHAPCKCPRGADADSASPGNSWSAASPCRRSSRRVGGTP